MTDSQLIKNAEDPNIYGRFVDVGTAFNKGLMVGTKGNPSATSNPVSTVKNNYENKLNSYLDALPADTDITGIPDKYKNNIHQFLQAQKHNYVVFGRQLAQHQVGSDKYMDLQSQMTNIKNSFTNLNDHMKNYGQMKDKLFEDIKTNRTSLSIENQANVNMLSSVFSEEFEMSIDEYGNPSFVGDDGAIQMGKLPGYELKSVTAANSMLKMADSVYRSGENLSPGHPQYEIKKRELHNMIEGGGRNTLMSIISDGMVGDVKMSEDPYIAEQVDAFKEGALSFEGLKEVVVENYMSVLSSMSNSGYKAKQRAVARRKLNNTSPNPNSSSTPRFIMSKMRFPGAIGNPPINGIEYTMVYDTEGNAYYKNPLKPGDGWISEKDVVNIKIASTPGNKTSPNVGANSKNAKSSGGNKIVLPVTGLKK
jgi:hypothetical protein